LFAPSVWSRFFAQFVDTHNRAFADPSASGNLWGLQLGVDLLRGSLIAGHYERAGLYGAFGSVNSDVHGLVTNPAGTAYILGRTGSLSLDALSAGGYWTHVGPVQDVAGACVIGEVVPRSSQRALDGLAEHR
jgi:outer membrane autotransporter protein